MFKRLKQKIIKLLSEPEIVAEKKEEVRPQFHDFKMFEEYLRKESPSQATKKVLERVFNRTAAQDYISTSSYTADSAEFKDELKVVQDSCESIVGGNLSGSFANNIPTGILAWYGAQSFLGWQIYAMMSQHWLVNKACEMPARDAIRKGFDITSNDGEEIEPKVIDEIKKLDKKYRLSKNCVEFVKMGRVFGIRIAMFKVDSRDKKYYEKPFNIDGVTPGSYKGIAQIDPYWITPLLDDDAAANPMSINFYEPTWWQINGVKVHRTHLVIFRGSEVPDILKPVYFYGGMPIPQKIFSRVYAAERTADEAPELAMTKRLMVMNIDIANAIANQESFEQRVKLQQNFRTNFSSVYLDTEDKVQQLETSLTDFDALMMSQYQIVAAEANIPAVKLLGTTPKGFNATGEYEEASYHEELESIQNSDLTPLIERHHELLIKSEICPKFKCDYFETTINWKTLDSFTAKESADINKVKAETAAVLIGCGALSPQDERERLIADKESGYNGMELEEENLEQENLEEEVGPDDIFAGVI